MTFAKKIFLSVFLTTFLVGSLLIWAAYGYVCNQTKEKFISRYSVFTKVLADTLTRFDVNTELLMHNAAKVVQLRDATSGVLTPEQLMKLRDDLKMTHIFIVNDKGEFIRSTNEDPKLIPNMFSFCGDYKNLVTGSSDVEATPIIKPDPEPKPFKFLSIPSKDRKRIIEVGIRVDFIGKTLAEAIGSDENVTSMLLYAPDGTKFGRYDASGVQFSEGQFVLPTDFSSERDNGDSYSFFSKVVSSHPKCCQCDVAGTSRNGEYYYVLESRVSKSELKTVMASTGWAFFGFGVGNIILSLLLGRFLSKRLVQNIEQAASAIREMQDTGDFNKRIGLKGSDEVVLLTNEFDRLLDDLDGAKQKVIESERVQAKMQLAREVAHNIKSPIHAIEIMLPTLTSIPERVKKVLTDSVKEIKILSQKLKKQSEGEISDESAWAATDVILVPALLDEIVERKRLEYSDRNEIEILFDRSVSAKPLFVKADATDLKAIISNLINNAIESGTATITINVSCRQVEGECLIEVSDNGVGIPPDLVDQIGKKRITFKGDSSRGLGLVHAFEKVETWGGSVKVSSELGGGSSVIIRLHSHIEDFKKKRNAIEQHYNG